MIKNVEVTVEGKVIYGTESMDGIYYVQANTELEKGEFILYKELGETTLMKVRNNNKGRLPFYLNRFWGNTVETGEEVLDFVRQKYVELLQYDNVSEEQLLDKKFMKTYYEVQTNEGTYNVHSENRLSKGQIITVNGEEYYRVDKVDNKTRQVDTEKLTSTVVLPLYKKYTSQQEFKLVGDYAESL